MNISPALKGFITAISIIVVSAAAFSHYSNFDNPVLLIAYAIYAAGIVWTLLAYHRAPGEKDFKSYFSQGFKCFIVVTLMMVIATWVFVKFNVKMQEQMVNYQRVLLQQEPNLTDVDVEQRLITFRKFILPGYTMGAIISYLGIGALITAIVSLFLSRYKRQPAGMLPK
jgi:hypothetical protein